MSQLKLLLLFTAAAALPQQPPSNTAELETKDAPVKFTSRVNLVPVTVVVRDSRSQAVGNLTKDDFRLFDNGKPQVISRFSVERPSAAVVIEKEDSSLAEPATPPAGATPAAPPSVADLFVAYVFDDLHGKFDELARSRDAASRQIAMMHSSERAAVYTLSGQVTQEFTDDQTKLQQTLLHLRPVNIDGTMGTGMDCPDISYYMADLIVNMNDQQATQTALINYQACSGNPNASASQITGYAQRALDIGQHGTQLATKMLTNIVRRIAAMPGQRSIVLSSPGFYATQYDQPWITDVINQAIRGNVIIGALDARGLWTPPQFDASRPTPMGGPQVLTFVGQYLQFEARAQEDVLAQLADGTGGTFFHNNNDINEGYRRLGSSPEFIYVLGFSPTNLKSDGKFHNIKINLVTAKGLTIQARKGYYAPRRDAKAADKGKEDIEDAVFSREVMKDIPVSLHTQFFKSGDYAATLSVVARIDIKDLHYRKEEGRYRDNLTIVTAIFDINGNYVAGSQKVIELRLKEETLQKRLGSGITLKTPLEIKTGNYVVRVVVRDSEGEMMAALNDAVDIP